LRALVYVLSGERSLDERASAVLVQITANSPALQELAFGGFGDLLGDQQMIMRLEPQRGLDVMRHRGRAVAEGWTGAARVTGGRTGKAGAHRTAP
jgi:hypothetical protein